MSFSTAGGTSGPEINVTPLIDVLLTLIIVFMVVVSMDKDTGEQAQLPQPDKQQNAVEKESTAIVVQLAWNKDGTATVKINHDDVAWKDLGARLQEIYIARADKVVFLKGDDDVEFQYVAEAIDLAHHAGVQRVGLLGKDSIRD